MMMTKKEKKRVPELRFPGFEGEWEEYEFSELAKRRKQSYNPNKDTKNYSCIELESLTQETGILIRTFNSVDLKSNKTKFLKGDVLFGKLRPYLRKYFLTDFDGVCTSEIWVLKGQQVNNNYLFYLIQTDKFIYEANVTTGSKMPRADWEYMSGIKYSIPSKEEQQKIATFLTTIDTRIQQLEKKKTLLEQYKKGVMQKIFSQEIRFRDQNGKEFGKWEEKRLGDVAIKKSSNIATNKIEDNFGEYIIYGAPGILKRVDFYEEENDYISIVKDGAGVGRVLYCEGKSSVLATLDMIKPKKGLNTYFLYCLLENINFVKYVTGSTIPHIYFKDYKKELIAVPTLPEQTKIAQFLSALDRKIAAMDGQIEKTKEWKKGLLQRMFV